MSTHTAPSLDYASRLNAIPLVNDWGQAVALEAEALELGAPTTAVAHCIVTRSLTAADKRNPGEWTA